MSKERKRGRSSAKTLLREREREIEENSQNHTRSSVHIFDAALKDDLPSEDVIKKANSMMSESPESFKGLIWSCNWSQGGTFSPIHGFSALLKADSPIVYSLFDSNKLGSGISFIKVKGIQTKENHPINIQWISNNAENIIQAIDSSLSLEPNLKPFNLEERVKRDFSYGAKIPSDLILGHSSSSFAGIYRSEEKSFSHSTNGYKDSFYIVCQSALPDEAESVCHDIHEMASEAKISSHINFKTLLKNYDGLYTLEKSNTDFRKRVIQKIGDALKLDNFNVEFHSINEMNRYSLTEFDNQHLLYNSGTTNVSPNRFQNFGKTYIPIAENPVHGISLISLEKPTAKTSGNSFFKSLAFPLSTGKIKKEFEVEKGNLAISDEIKRTFLWKPSHEVPTSIRKSLYRPLDHNFVSHLKSWGLKKKVQLRPVFVALSNT
jgi:hypothetical protein